MSMTSLTIVIGNKEYSVKGENEELMRKATEVVNQKIKEVSEKSIGSETMPFLTKTTLAALNIAESSLKNDRYFIAQENKIIDEINKITNFIETNLNTINID